MFAVRIAFLTLQWPGVRMGGIGAAVKQNALALADAGHDVHVFTLAMPADASRPDTLTIHECDDLSALVNRNEIPGASAASIHAGGEGAYRLSLAWRLCQALIDIHQHQPFDVVETPEVEALGLPLLMSADFSAPVVTQLHCCTALAAKMNRAERGEDQTLAALEFATLHLSDGLIAPTQAVVDATRKLTSVREGVEIIPHSVTASSDFDLPSAGPVVFVGRLERLKGVELIAQALNQFLRNCPTATFQFIGPDTSVAADPSVPTGRTPSLTLPRATGSGNKENAAVSGLAYPSADLRTHTQTTPAPGTLGEGWGGGSTAVRETTGGSMRDRLTAMLDDAVRDRVEFTGELPPAAIAEAWRSARFGVMPSIWENFSIAACEAMSHGRTLIVAAGTGSVEVVGDAGIVVPQNDPIALAEAMTRLWNDTESLNLVSRAAYYRITTRFSPAQIAQQRTAYYADLINRFHAIDRTARLQSLPPAILADILPALVRMTGSLAACPAASTQTPGSRLLQIMARLENQHGQPAQLMLYGAGKHTAKLLSERHLWESRSHRVIGIIDDHPRFAQTPVYLDVPVLSMNTAAAQVLGGKKLPPVVLSTDTYADQFWRQSAPLRAAGVQVFRLY